MINERKMKTIKSMALASVIVASGWLPLTASGADNSCTDYSVIDNAPSFISF